MLKIPKSFAELQALNVLLKKYRDIYPYRIVICYVITYFLCVHISVCPSPPPCMSRIHRVANFRSLECLFPEYATASLEHVDKPSKCFSSMPWMSTQRCPFALLP